MKSTILLALFISFNLCLFGQQGSRSLQPNIVPNPGFERLSSSPIGWFYKGKHFTDVMKYWNSPTGASPDVFGPKVRVPGHWAEKGFGLQSPRSGNNMVGLTSYGCTNGKPHCREYIEIQLLEPLVIGQNYYAEYWVAHLPRSLQANNLGMSFHVEKTDEAIALLLDYPPVILSEKILQPPANGWMKVSGHFTAKEAANYLIIGNFFPDSLTRTRYTQDDHFNFAYYYIDDVLIRKEDPILPVPKDYNSLKEVSVEVGKTIHLRNIFFDHDKATFLARSYKQLNELHQLMISYPEMIIEISGHTDNTGDDDYNYFLSRKRARAVVGFLRNKGIEKWRTRYRGYGSKQPIASNENSRGRQLNRRVEFLIVRK